MPTICEIPVIPPYAVRVNDQQSYKIGDVMELACRSGYTMDDSSTNTSVCQPDGTFAEIRLICNMGNLLNVIHISISDNRFYKNLDDLQ